MNFVSAGNYLISRAELHVAQFSGIDEAPISPDFTVI